MKTIRVPKPRDPFHNEIQARIALKRSAGKREPVAAPFALPRAYRALAASVRACVGAVGSVLSEVR